MQELDRQRLAHRLQEGHDPYLVLEEAFELGRTEGYREAKKDTIEKIGALVGGLK